MRSRCTSIQWPSGTRDPPPSAAQARSRRAATLDSTASREVRTALACWLEDDAQQHGKSQPRSYASTPEPIPMAEGTGSGRGAARVRLGRDGPVTVSYTHL